MAINTEKLKYVPGTYATKRPKPAQLVNQYFLDWERRRFRMKRSEIEKPQIAPTICFSRKIGAGALEIADLLSEKINYRVADREMLDHIANDKQISAKTIEFFDERYPGKISELARLLFGEKSFIMSDYIKSFISAVYTFADTGPTIFVGRGTHLILPRNRVLAVRIICSVEYRVKRLANILGIEEDEAEKLIVQIDKEQRVFFKKAFGKKDASPYEFDLVINSDFITSPVASAKIVAQAFKEKFIVELEKRPVVYRNVIQSS
ncbi:MAG: cytidylate kinase-like family protein [Desulfobacterales bacterium]|jgi:cytidylate kinase